LSGLVDTALKQARSFYYDTLVFDLRTLKFLVDVFGITQLCIGTDYPFGGHEKQPTQPIMSLEISAGDRRLLLADNAVRFLGEDSDAAVGA